MKEIRIYIRDIDGWCAVKTFTSRQDAYAFCLEEFQSEAPEDEIQIVIVDGAVIYSALGNAEVSWEELVAFFA